MSNCRSSLLLLLLLAIDARAAEQPLAPSTIVIFNKAVPESVELARFYAQQRGIARDHLIGLTCSTEEEISRDEYDTTIAEPLREIFRQRHWWEYFKLAEGAEKVTASSIQFAAVMKGIPLKIRPTATPYPGDGGGIAPIGNRNEASVDSELSVVALSRREISGVVANPYFQNYRGIREVESSVLLLACRLDAPTAGMVRRMITDSVVAEKRGLWGRAFLDASHNSAPGGTVGDGWIKDVSKQLHQVGVPVVYDDFAAVLPAGFPVTDCALYYGWYAGNITGPFAQSDFRFIPGAVAVHIHSFSGATLRDPNSGWAAPLIAHGAAATMGNVYEPFLQLTPHLNLFNDRLLHGFTFAECAYMSIPALSWMSVMVGDPLYRPYATSAQIDGPREVSRIVAEWKAYHDFAMKNGSQPEYRTLVRQFATRARNGSILEDLGGMEVADGNFTAALSYFQQARSTYTRGDDILRATIEEVDTLVNQKKQKRAVDLVRNTLRAIPEGPSAQLLKSIERELTAPPPLPTPVP